MLTIAVPQSFNFFLERHRPLTPDYIINDDMIFACKSIVVVVIALMYWIFDVPTMTDAVPLNLRWIVEAKIVNNIIKKC